MRVLVVSQYYWPETFRITEVVQALRDEGCEVLVLTGQPNYPEGVPFKGYSWWSMRTEQHDGVTIFRVPLFPRGQGSALRLVLNYLSFVCFATVFGPWMLRGRSIDSILVFAPSPIIQAIPAIWLAKLKKASSGDLGSRLVAREFECDGVCAQSQNAFRRFEYGSLDLPKERSASGSITGIR